MPRRICVTGGPCGGKTSIIGYLSDTFSDSLLVVPEVASFCAGVGIERNDSAGRLVFQRVVLGVQLCLQENVAAVSGVTGKHVILDRGVLDCFAYVEDAALLLGNVTGQAIAEYMAWYDAVIHVTSLASDFPELYVTDERNFRSEAVAEARALDMRLEQLWSPHRNYHRVRCSLDSISGKRESVLRILRRYIDI